VSGRVSEVRATHPPEAPLRPTGDSGMAPRKPEKDIPRTVRFRIFRGSRGAGLYSEYEVENEEGMVVLDAVHQIQARSEPDLAVRWNCKAGKCGSCSAEVNGVPKLMCMTRIDTLDPTRPVSVAPIKAFPHVKDLVADVAWNYEVNKRIPPFTPAPMTKAEAARGEFRMAQQDVDRLQEFRKCIECFLCQDVCHVLRDAQKKHEFFGPRFFIRLAGLDMHPKDDLDRVPMTKHAAGVELCNITKCCTEVCPEHIKITDNGIIPMKERVVDRYYDPILVGWRIVSETLTRWFSGRDDEKRGPGEEALERILERAEAGTNGAQAPKPPARPPAAK